MAGKPVDIVSMLEWPGSGGSVSSVQATYEFSDFTGTYLSLLRIEFREWLWLLKLFDLEVSARKAANPHYS